ADRSSAVAGRLEAATDLGAPRRQSHLERRDEPTAIEPGCLYRARCNGQLFGQSSAIDDVALPDGTAHAATLSSGLFQALKVPPGIDGDDRADPVLQMGNASHHREGRITTATLPMAARVFSVSFYS